MHSLFFQLRPKADRYSGWLTTSYSIIVIGLRLVITACILSCSSNQQTKYESWAVYGGSKESIHYSSLTQIDTSNVTQLRPVWTYHTGDADTAKHSQMQCNPIIVNGVMYVTSPKLRLIALDAETGKEKWVFDPDSSNKNKEFYHFILNNNRGVTYWAEGEDQRILYTAGSSLYAINAQSGIPVRSFGNNGRIDLHDGLGRNVNNLYVAATSPGIIFKDLYITGSRVDEGPASAPGHIRAYDVRTGKIRWIFHTIPQPGEYGYETWEDPEAWKHIGGANSWPGLSIDEKRGMLFVPTGSASFDFYGGKRKGSNLFANCLLALDALTGKRIWHFQFVHHDIWDWDTPAAPALITVQHDGKKTDAIAQTTKNGFVYLFERETGKPLFDIEEVPVSTETTLVGEKPWPTQPIPKLPLPFVRQTFTEQDINPYLPDTSIARLKQQLQTYRYGKIFIPPGKQTSVVFPGFDGGAEWGGPSFDPSTGILYVNANEMGWLLTIRDNPKPVLKNENNLQAGIRLYTQYCMSCHGADRKGSGNYPSITNAKANYSPSSMTELLNTGRRMMPAFRQLAESEKTAIISYMLDLPQEQRKDFIAPKTPIDTFVNLPYTITGYYKFLSPEGYPAIKPPWGTLNAIDLNDGKLLWKVTLGEYPELKQKGIPPTGTENYGGSVVTAGGLVFIAAAGDGKIRAFNKKNGELLWESQLPAPGFATPSVYSINGKQFIVIACGGGKLKTISGDTYMTFALPGK